MSCDIISPKRFIAIALLVLLAATVDAPSNVARSQTPGNEEARIDAALRKADQLENDGKYDESIALMDETVKSARRTFPANHPAVAAALHGLGCAYFGGGRYDEAEPLLREALKIARAHPAENGTLRLSALNNLVTLLLKRANYAEALPLCEESLKGVEQALGSDDWRTNMARNVLAGVYLKTKRPADAIPIARIALKYAIDKYQADDPETIPFRNTLSMALLEDAQYPEAEQLFKESLTIAEKRLTPKHEATLATLSGLAAVCQQTGRLEEAAEYTKRASGTAGGVEAGGRQRDADVRSRGPEQRGVDVDARRSIRCGREQVPPSPGAEHQEIRSRPPREFGRAREPGTAIYPLGKVCRRSRATPRSLSPQ